MTDGDIINLTFLLLVFGIFIYEIYFQTKLKQSSPIGGKKKNKY